MRRLAVLHVHLGVRDGGAERQTVALLRGMAALGHRVIGIVRRGSPAERRAVAAGAPIFPLGPRFPLGPGGLFTWWSRQRARLLAARGDWDLIHFHDPESYALTADLLSSASPGRALAPSRMIVTYRGQRRAFSSRAPAELRRHHRSGGTTVPASEALWAALVREKYDEELLSFIHPGIDMRLFSGDAALRDAMRRALGFDDRTEAVGTVAVLDRDRGVERLLEAAAVLARDRSSARLVIVGDGPARRGLETRAASLGLGGITIFTGWREDVHQVLQALDAYVFAGEGGEVFPSALVEAMAIGIPVVVSDQPGIWEIIENGKQGLFVPERGAESLARTVFRLLADREISRAMGRAGSVRVQRFHIKSMVGAHEALYYRVSKIERDS